jgi:hypothetical protein
MHTSTHLRAGHFHFLRHTAGGAQALDFAGFCPDYHELDRVGVVSLHLEDGICHTSYAILALTTAFYDQLRARGGDFFDYPQHFAFVGAEDGGVHSGNGLLALQTPKLWDGWSWLDVWPEAKCVPTPSTASGMLRRAFDYQINRLFWPRALQPGVQETQLPAYAWKMLKTRVKAVYLYGESGQAEVGQRDDQVEIRAAAPIEEVVQESLARLPAAANLPNAQPPFPPQCYEMVAVNDFLTAMQHGLTANH